MERRDGSEEWLETMVEAGINVWLFVLWVHPNMLLTWVHCYFTWKVFKRWWSYVCMVIKVWYGISWRMLHSLKPTAKAPENRPKPTPHREIHLRLTSWSTSGFNQWEWVQPLPDISRKKHVHPPKTIMDIKKKHGFQVRNLLFSRGLLSGAMLMFRAVVFLWDSGHGGGVPLFVKMFSSDLYGVYLPKHC